MLNFLEESPQAQWIFRFRTVFADLTDWAGSQLQIRAMNAQGQEVMNYTVNGLDFDQIVFPESLADGLYFIEFSSTNGDRLVKRVVLRR